MRIYILICGLLFAAACGSDSTPPSSHNQTWEVVTLSTAFSPNINNIARGDTIRFVIVPSSNGEGHDVTFKATPGAPPSILATKNGIFTRVFTTGGTFHYDCFVHPGMSGDVVVQ